MFKYTLINISNLIPIVNISNLVLKTLDILSALYSLFMLIGYLYITQLH